MGWVAINIKPEAVIEMFLPDGYYSLVTKPVWNFVMIRWIRWIQWKRPEKTLVRWSFTSESHLSGRVIDLEVNHQRKLFRNSFTREAFTWESHWLKKSIHLMRVLTICFTKRGSLKCDCKRCKAHGIACPLGGTPCPVQGGTSVLSRENSCHV